MIETHQLTKYYGPKQVLQDVSFRVEKGEILGFLGPNGAGKTTTMRILTCYLAPSRGTASVAGFDILENPLEVRRRLGYLPENVPLYEEMRVNRYLDFVAEVKGIASRDQRRNKVGGVVESCGLTRVQERILGNLSKGFRQRVGLAQALLGDPEILILDEPTVGLDPQQIIEIRSLIKSLGGDHTVILSTHILPEVEVTCNRVVIIHEGKVVAQDTPKKLTHRLQGGARIQVTLSGKEPAKILALLKSVPGAKKVTQQSETSDGYRFLVECDAERDLRSELAQVAVQNGLSLLDLRSRDLTLEEIFIQTITEGEVLSHA